MQKTVLITGGAGFIGSHLIDKLIDTYNVICVDDLNNFYSPLIKKENIKVHYKKNNFKLYKIDIRIADTLKKVFVENKIDLIIHLAARAGVRESILNPKLYEETNIKGTVNLLEFAKNNNIKKFIYASSSSVYGPLQNGPFNEEMKTNNQISPYARTKALCEQICQKYSELYNIQINCLRFFTVYGPRQRPDLAIHKFVSLITRDKPITIYGDGTTARDYTYISDIIQGILGAIQYDKTPFEIFNLGAGQKVELNYLIEIIEKELKKKAIINTESLPKCDVPLTYADITKAAKLLNYRPKITIEEGIKKYLRWVAYRKKLILN